MRTDGDVALPLALEEMRQGFLFFFGRGGRMKVRGVVVLDRNRAIINPHLLILNP